MTQDDFEERSFGYFEALVEEGAVFKPAFIQGSTSKEKINRIYLEKEACIFGSNIFLNEGDIYVCEGTKIEPNVGIKGPTIIGRNNDI